MKHLVVSCILFFLLFCSEQASSQTIIPKKLDSALSGFSKGSDPGFSVAVVQLGETKYARGFGMADLAKQKKNTSSTPFDIASASKQFTAASIYLLEQQGKLNTSDKLSKYFHDFPAYADTITIDHLIHHQSGLRDFSALIWLRDMIINSAYQDADAYQILARQKSLNFHPGDGYSYTNSGYFLLSLIVKQVSGQDLQDFADKNIFKPLKMNHTAFSRSHKVAYKAIGYTFDGKSLNEFHPHDSTIGHSHVYSSVTDWQQWFKEMKDHKLLGDAVWNKMVTAASINNGTDTKYAGGLVNGKYENKAALSHGGDLYGYHSKMIWFPKEDLGIIVMTNKEELYADPVLVKIYQTIYNTTNPVEPVKTEQAAVQIPVTIDTSLYTGTYRSDGDSEVNFEVTAVDSNLRVNQLWDQVDYQVNAANDSLFYIGNDKSISFTFQGLKKGKANKIAVSQENKLTYFTRLAKGIAPGAETIKTYVGRYYNDEIDAYYTVFEEAGKLKIKIGELGYSALGTGKKENYAIIDNGLHFTFHRDKNAKIDGLDLVHLRVSDLHFVKK